MPDVQVCAVYNFHIPLHAWRPVCAVYNFHIPLHAWCPGVCGVQFPHTFTCLMSRCVQCTISVYLYMPDIQVCAVHNFCIPLHAWRPGVCSTQYLHTVLDLTLIIWSPPLCLCVPSLLLLILFVWPCSMQDLLMTLWREPRFWPSFQTVKWTFSFWLLASLTRWWSKVLRPGACGLLRLLLSTSILWWWHSSHVQWHSRQVSDFHLPVPVPPPVLQSHPYFSDYVVTGPHPVGKTNSLMQCFMMNFLTC